MLKTMRLALFAAAFALTSTAASAQMQLKAPQSLSLSATPNEIVQYGADNIPYNLNAVTVNLERVRDAIVADQALPVEEREIDPNTMMAMAEGLVSAGQLWSRIGNAINAIDDYMPELPPEE